jgi:putative polyketide hydroxylase
VAVLIVGGGPVGLCGSLQLARHGVRSLLVERHPGTSIQPKARRLSIRTMELLRAWGLEDQVRAASVALAGPTWFLWAESLAGREIHRIESVVGEDASSAVLEAVSPTSGCACAQDDLEPILLAAARRYPEAEIRFNAELVALEQDAAGVRAVIRDRASGRDQVVHAQFVVATDGGHSPVRQLLGIRQQRLSAAHHVLSIYFRSDLTRALRARTFSGCQVQNAAVTGLLLPAHGTDRWLFHLPLGPDERAATYDAARCLAVVRAAVGEPGLRAEILGTQTFTSTAAMAERFREGRVFLAGDAAHVMPPAGAWGLNTGIQDVHNLAWKLAGVLQGWAGPSLLDSYDAERRPVGRATVQRAALRQQALELGALGRTSGAPALPLEPGLAPPWDAQPDSVLPLALALGYGYASRAVCGSAVPPDEPIPTAFARVTQTGRRAPHLWVTAQGRRRSLLNLFGAGYTLLAGPAGERWLAAIRALSWERPVPRRCYGLAPAGDLHADAGAWTTTYQVAADGAALVRPDGFLAWMAPDAHPAELASLPTVLADTLAW